MKLLVAGATAVDAGKTTFSVGLCHETGATGYKPRAGNDYWYDHDDYRRAIDEGRLYGTDARRLAAASPGDRAPEEINPVHRLWLPVPGRGTGILGRDERAFAIDRVTFQSTDGGGSGGGGGSAADTRGSLVGDGRQSADRSPTGSQGARGGGGPFRGAAERSTDRERASDATSGIHAEAGDAYVVNAEVDVPDSATATLPVAGAPRVSSVSEFNELMERLHRPAMASLTDRVRLSDRAVVESYADIARPLSDLEADAVAVVEARRVRVFDGERYLKGCDVASGSAREGRLEERVENVLDLVEPVATVELPALTSEERSDPAAVADAYGPAYDALLATAL